MTVSLRPITLEECQLVREWRNAPDVLPMLRTGYKTAEQQALFFVDVVRNPDSIHRYYAIETQDRGGLTEFVGMGGLTYLTKLPDIRETRAEISLIIGPAYRRHGIGRMAVAALLTQGFEALHLTTVVGECYDHSPALMFWHRITSHYRSSWCGQWFWIRKGDWQYADRSLSPTS